MDVNHDSDFIIYGNVPSLNVIRESILSAENMKLAALYGEFQNSSYSENADTIKKALQQIYLQALECNKRALRDGIDDAMKEDTFRETARVMAKVSKAISSSAAELIHSAKSFNQTAELYGGKQAHELAMATGETELTYEEWVSVRTPEFKESFFDWEQLANEQFMTQKPEIISALADNPDLSKISEISAWAGDYFEKNNINEVFHDDIGDIMIDKKSIKDSLSHGYSKEKIQVIAALPKLLAKAKVLHRESKERGQIGYVLGVPVEVNGEPFVAAMVVKKSDGSNRFYLHEVVLKEKLLEAIKTPASAEHVPDSVELNNEAKLGVVRTILLKSLKVNKINQNHINQRTKEPSKAYLKEYFEHKRNLSNELFAKKIEAKIKREMVATTSKQYVESLSL